MQTYECLDIKFHYDDMRKNMSISKKGEVDFYLPMESVLRFVAHVIREEHLGEIQKSSDAQVLRLPVVPLYDPSLKG